MEGYLDFVATRSDSDPNDGDTLPNTPALPSFSAIFSKARPVPPPDGVTSRATKHTTPREAHLSGPSLFRIERFAVEVLSADSGGFNLGWALDAFQRHSPHIQPNRAEYSTVQIYIRMEIDGILFDICECRNH